MVLVAPVADGHAVWEITERVGVVDQDVTPHEHFAAVELWERTQGLQPCEVVVEPVAGEFPGFV